MARRSTSRERIDTWAQRREGGGSYAAGLRRRQKVTCGYECQVVSIFLIAYFTRTPRGMHGVFRFPPLCHTDSLSQPPALTHSKTFAGCCSLSRKPLVLLPPSPRHPGRPHRPISLFSLWSSSSTFPCARGPPLDADEEEDGPASLPPTLSPLSPVLLRELALPFVPGDAYFE